MRKFIEHILTKEKEGSLEPGITVELIKLIFNLALSEFNQAYKLHTTARGTIRQIVRQNFEQMGLIEFTLQDPDKFYITKYM